MTKATTPLSYATAAGVRNTKVKNQVAHDWEGLVQALSAPTQLDTTATVYRKADKVKRDTIKLGLPYFVGGKVNGPRKDENIEHRSLLTLDIEAKSGGETQPPPPQEVLQALKDKGASGWVYTTISHTDQSPRYRVVLPLLEPIKDARWLEATTRRAADALGIADWCQPESWVLSQVMFLPAKLKGGKVWQGHHNGKAWKPSAPAAQAPADMPEGKVDPVLHALRRAGLYINEDPGHKGKHFITCPFADEHGVINDTQTVYYEAHHDGNPRPAVKCLDTSPDHDGKPHLTYRALVQWLREAGHLSDTEEDANTAEVLEDFAAFDARAGVAELMRAEPVAREWAWRNFAPIGKVTVVAGPGGVSKSMLMLHLLVYGAAGEAFAGIEPVGKLRSIYVSYEDDKEELGRRMYQLAEALRQKDEGVFDLLNDLEGDLGQNLRLYATDTDALKWLLITKPDPRGNPERTARVEWLIGYLRFAHIKVLVLDPVVYTHMLMESDNGDMAAYMQMLTYIAKAAGVAVVVLHHTAKQTQWATLDEIHQGSMRGASSIADNARSVMVMVSMPQKDAPKYGLPASDDTSARYVVLKHAKHNYSASLGVRVFERAGPLLLPRDDIQRLPPDLLAKQKEAQAEQKKDSTRYAKAVALAEYLYEQPDHSATATQCDKQLGKHAQDLDVRRWCVGQGYVSVPPRHKNGTALIHTLTPKGIEELLDGGLD